MSIADRFNLLDEMQRVVREAEGTTNYSLARFARSGETPATLTTQFTPSPGMLASVVPVGPGRYVVRVPQGIGFRLLAWLRLLMAYWGKGNVNLDVSPFAGFDPATYKLPEAVRPIFDDFVDLDELKQAIGGMDFRRPLDDVVWTSRIEPMLGLGGLLIVLHEAAHVALRHFPQEKLIRSGHHLDEFGLTPSEAQRCMELDADRFAALRTVEFALGMVKSDPRGSWVLGDIALSCGFVWVALLGLFDHRRKLFDNFEGERYLPPTLRHWMMMSAAQAFLRERHPHLEQVWVKSEMHAWIQAVSATHLASVEYADLKKKSSYMRALERTVALKYGVLPPQAYDVWPLGGMVYGSLAELHQGRDLAWQEFERRVGEWHNRFYRFQKWQQATGEFAGGRADGGERTEGKAGPTEV